MIVYRLAFLRKLPWIVAICIVTGVAAIRYASASLDDIEYRPMTQPLPGIGYTVGDTFELLHGGRFMIQIASPTTDGPEGVTESPKQPVQCYLALLVRHPGGSWRAQSNANFRNGGRTRYTDLYIADNMIALERGKYELILKRTGNDDPFAGRGAMLTLVRAQAPGPEFGYFGLELCGYAMLVAAATAAWWRSSMIGTLLQQNCGRRPTEVS